MSWSSSWDLECQADGFWKLDKRPWLPPETRVDLCFWRDFDNATEGISFDVMHLIKSISRNGVPDDVSQSYIDRWRDFVLHCQEEGLQMPIFTWVQLKDTLDLNWDSVVQNNSAKRLEIDRWVEHLQSLGRPENFRVICCTHR